MRDLRQWRCSCPDITSVVRFLPVKVTSLVHQRSAQGIGPQIHGPKPEPWIKSQCPLHAVEDPKDVYADPALLQSLST
jgi:hypothetical protein